MIFLLYAVQNILLEEEQFGMMRGETQLRFTDKRR
jgi:hypothetical protein